MKDLMIVSLAMVFGMSTLNLANAQTCGPTAKYDGRTDLPNGDTMFDLPQLRTNGGKTYYFQWKSSFGEHQNICAAYLGMKSFVDAGEESNYRPDLIEVDKSGRIHSIGEGNYSRVKFIVCR